jgi:hypothetical protein
MFEALRLVREMPEDARTQFAMFVHAMADAGEISAQAVLEGDNVVLTLRAPAFR